MRAVARCPYHAVAAAYGYGRCKHHGANTAGHTRVTVVQNLCYAQLGELAFATVVTLILLPVLYSFFVLDLGMIKWQQLERPHGERIQTLGWTRGEV